MISGPVMLKSAILFLFLNKFHILNSLQKKEKVVEVAGVEPASKASQIIRRSQG